MAGKAGGWSEMPAGRSSSAHSDFPRRHRTRNINGLGMTRICGSQTGEITFRYFRAICGVTGKRFAGYQSDVYSKTGRAYYATRGLAVLGEGCRGVLN